MGSRIVPIDEKKLKRKSTIRFRSNRGLLIQDRAPAWLRCFYIQMNSNARYLIDFISFINLMYIGMVIPLQIGFNLEMVGATFGSELISILISVFILVTNFRTPVMVKGEATLKFTQVLKYQWQNGLILDILGILPFNLIFGVAYLKPNIPIALLRCLRIASAWKSMQIFGQFEIFLKKYNLIMQILKAFLLLFFLCHITACLWFFVQILIHDSY